MKGLQFGREIIGPLETETALADAPVDQDVVEQGWPHDPVLLSQLQ